MIINTPCKYYSADIETTGLLDEMKQDENAKLHVFSFIDMKKNMLAKEKPIVLYGEQKKEIQEFLDTSPTLFIHNGVSFDIPALKFFGFDVSKVKVIDTLWLSWYLFPDRFNKKHGLEYYGQMFNIIKPEITDWKRLTKEEYAHRVSEDVLIQEELTNFLLKYLNNLYECKTEQILSHLYNKAKQIYIQEQNPILLDTDKLISTIEQFNNEVVGTCDILAKSMPRVPEYVIKERPKKMYKKDLGLSKLGEEWKKICDENGLDYKDESLSIKYVKKYKAPNPNSVSQVKDWLFNLGWVPETFKDTINSQGESKEVPQISLKNVDEPTLCPSIYKLIEEHPEKGIKTLETLGIYRHRLGLAKGWERDKKGNTITAGCSGLTNSLRLKHRGLVNIPAPRTYGGAQLRSLLVAKDTTQLLGADLSSLEEVCKQNLIYKYDPELVRSQQSEDYDAHLNLGVLAGFITEEQANLHKKKVIQLKERQIFKNTNYACQYGAGISKIASTAGCSLEEAKILHKTYWKINWSIKEAEKSFVIQEFYNPEGKYEEFWLKHPVTKLMYNLRNTKDSFNLVCQSMGAYIFDRWIYYIVEEVEKQWGVSPPLKMQFHDEIVLEIKKGTNSYWEKVLTNSLDKVNKELNLTIPVKCDIKVGTTYADIH